MPSSFARACAVHVSLAVLTAAAGLSVGCSDGGHLFARNDEKPVVLKGSEAIDRDAYGKLGYALAWSSFASIDRAGKGVVDRAAVLGDLLVIADDTTATSALRTSNGQIKWGLKVDNRAGRFLAMARRLDTVLAMNETELFVINAETGDLSDRQKLTHLASTPPVVLGTTAVYASGNQVIGHSMVIKEQIWGYRYPAPIMTNPTWVGSTAVCFISGDGTVGIMDCGNGTMLGLNRMYGAPGAPAASSDDCVFVPSLDQSLWAFDINGGKRRWQLRTEVPLTATPSVLGQHVMVSVPGTGMVSVNARTGDQEWVNKTLTGKMVAVRKGNPVFFDRDTGVATLIDPARGDVIQQVKLDNVWVIANGGSFADGELYCVSKQGEVSKFVPQ